MELINVRCKADIETLDPTFRNVEMNFAKTE